MKYHADAASLFAHLDGTTTWDTVLLESADFTTRSGIQSVAVLRALGRFGFLAGGFAYDYLETFETLPAVAEGTNTYPDYQFVPAEALRRINHQSQSATLSGVGIDALAERIDAAPPTPLRSSEGVGGTLVAHADTPDAQFRHRLPGRLRGVPPTARHQSFAVHVLPAGRRYARSCSCGPTRRKSRSTRCSWTSRATTSPASLSPTPGGSPSCCR